MEDPLSEGEDEHPRLERHPSLTRQITTEYLRLGHMFLGKTDGYQISPTSRGAAGSAAPAAASAEGASSESGQHIDGSDDGRPSQQPPPDRGAHSNGVAKDERGRQARAGPGMRNSRRARRVTRCEEEDEEGVEMRATTKSGAVRKQEEGEDEGEEEGRNDPSFEGASGGPDRVERGNSRSPPRPLHRAGGRSLARGPYRSGVDGVADRWIGFAGSPRGDRSTLQGPRQSGSDVEGQEVVGNGVEYFAASGSSAKSPQDDGEEPAVGSVAAPQGETWAVVESEGNSRSLPRPLHRAGERGLARGSYQSGEVDGVADRLIGFAGSPRGDRPTLQGPRRSGRGDVEGEELVGNGVEYYAAGGSSANLPQDDGEEAAVGFVAAPQGETWAEVESEAFLEEGLEEMLSGTSR